MEEDDCCEGRIVVEPSYHRHASMKPQGVSDQWVIRGKKKSRDIQITSRFTTRRKKHREKTGKEKKEELKQPNILSTQNDAWIILQMPRAPIRIKQCPCLNIVGEAKYSCWGEKNAQDKSLRWKIRVHEKLASFWSLWFPLAVPHWIVPSRFPALNNTIFISF